MFAFVTMYHNRCRREMLAFMTMYYNMCVGGKCSLS